LGAKGAYDAAPTRAAYDHAQALSTWTTVAFVAGGVFTAGGVVLLLLPESKARAALSLRPDGVVARGTF
jgi:hypothetical protein